MAEAWFSLGTIATDNNHVVVGVKKVVKIKERRSLGIIVPQGAGGIRHASTGTSGCNIDEIPPFFYILKYSTFSFPCVIVVRESCKLWSKALYRLPQLVDQHTTSTTSLLTIVTYGRSGPPISLKLAPIVQLPSPYSQAKASCKCPKPILRPID